MQHTRDEKYIQILVGKPDGRRPAGRPKHRCELMLEWILGKHSGKDGTGCIWLRVGTSGMPLET